MWTMVVGVLWLGAAGAVRGQVESGKVVGAVRDTSGAAVPGVEVHVTNTETNVTHMAVTAENGEYVATELKPGTYTVSVERTGFKKVEQAPFKLDINQVVRVDLTLTVGATSQEVVVQSTAEPLVESQTSSIGQVIDENRVHDLPLNGRDFIELAYLSPGVNQGPAGIVQQGGIPENERGNGAIQANGLMATNNNFLLNGFDNNEQQIGFEIIQPPIDAIQEFKVQTSNFGADIGKGGAVVNVVLKSGTNQLHGSVYEFIRNSALDAKNFFDDPTVPIAPFKQNQFGGTLGGPIIKNKTFFFVDYQGTRIRQSQTDISTVPTAQEHTGNFSDIGMQLTDPVTGLPFPNDQIPSCPSPTGGACIGPVQQKILNLYPLPNVKNAVNNVNNYLLNPVAKNNQDSFDVRVDHQLGTADSLFATFSYGNVDAMLPDPLPGLAGGGVFSGNINNKSIAAGVSDVHVFSASRVNEFKVGYMRYVVLAIPFFYGQPIAANIGIPGINIADDPATGGLPNFSVDGYSALGNQDYFPEKLRENNYQAIDSFTYTRGRHSFKFGLDLRARQHGFFQTQNPRGDFYFDGQYTGNALADLAIGDANSAFRDGQTGPFGMGWWELGAYAMDDFRLSPKLTLNLGVRWDLYTPMAEQHDRLANFDFATGHFVSPEQPGVSPSGDVVTNLKNFAPRIGFAYTPWSNKTVVRGGFGIFYDLQANQNDTELAFNPDGLFGSQSLLAPSFSLVPAPFYPSGFPTPVPFPTIADPSGRASAAVFNNGTTYIEEWNLNIEREVAKDSVLQVAYIGTHGVHLTYLRDLNQPVLPLDSNFALDSTGLPTNIGRPYFGTVPDIAAIRTEAHDLSSSTNGLQVRFEKRFSANWSTLTAYTYQHTIGQTAEDETAGTALEPQNTHDMRAERGDTEPDYRHQFTSATTFDLPLGPGHRWVNSDGLSRWIVGGWQLNAIVTMYSGRSFTPYLSFDPTNTGSGGPRPDVVGNPYNFSNATTVGFDGAAVSPSNGGCPSSHQSIFCWFNPAAFALPPLAPGQQFATEFGDAGRGILRGPAQYNVDFSIFKDFPFSESKVLQFRAEFFNLFNTPEFGDPNFLVDTQGAGSISSTVHPSREIQFALKFSF